MKVFRPSLVGTIIFVAAWSTVTHLAAEVLLVVSGNGPLNQSRIDLYDSETLTVLKKSYINPPIGYVSDMIYDSSGALFMTSGLSNRVAVYDTNPPVLRNSTLISPVL